MASVPSALRCTSPLGVVPVGWRDGVGLCRDATSFPENGHFISLGDISGVQNYAFFSGVWFLFGSYCWVC